MFPAISGDIVFKDHSYIKDSTQKTSENEEKGARSNPGANRHCSYGLCNSDSRYKDRYYMQGVFWIPFPKPKSKLRKCEKWVYACGRGNFGVENVKPWTYICSKHFVGGHGPTEENPDPVPATYTPEQVRNVSL